MPTVVVFATFDFTGDGPNNCIGCIPTNEEATGGDGVRDRTGAGTGADTTGAFFADAGAPWFEPFEVKTGAAPDFLADAGAGDDTTDAGTGAGIPPNFLAFL